MKLGTVLTVAAAILFGFFAARMVDSSAQAALSFCPVDFTASANTMKFFDRGSGEIYIYSDVDGKLYAHYRVVELGKQLENVSIPAEP